MATQPKRTTRRRSTAKTAADQALIDVQATEVTTTEAAAPEPEAVTQEAEATQETAIVRSEDTALAQMPEFPPLDAPAINASRPLRSYKPPFRLEEINSWMMSDDGGQTKKPIGSLVLHGLPFGLQLVVTKATWKEGWFDYRLSFSFTNREGELEELNLNAINPSRTNPDELMITGPARSLLGALLACSESEDDAHCFSQGVRMTLKPGARGSQFIDLDVNAANSKGERTWKMMGGAADTKRVPQGPAGLAATVQLVQERLCRMGVLQPGRAIVGDIPEEHMDQYPTVAVEATWVDDSDSEV
ncbi:MAG: hypothetical protein ACK2U9_14225 [Anaerolineae bacterium]